MQKIITFQSSITIMNVVSIQKELCDAIRDDTCDEVIFQLASEGGDIAAALSLYYWLESLDTDKIKIIVFSHLASAANTWLLTKHPTYSYPHCSFMFHPCSATLTFTVHSEKPVMADCRKRIQDYWQLYSVKTSGKINSKWIKDKEHAYLYPKDLIKLNILNGIIGE